MSRVRAFIRHDAGTTAAEFALVVPLFLLLTFGTINMGFALSALVRLHYVTERVARCLSVDTTGVCYAANVDTYAKTLYPVGGISGLAFVSAQPSCGNMVTANGIYNVYTGIGQIPITLETTACYPII